MVPPKSSTLSVYGAMTACPIWATTVLLLDEFVSSDVEALVEAKTIWVGRITVVEKLPLSVLLFSASITDPMV